MKLGLGLAFLLLLLAPFSGRAAEPVQIHEVQFGETLWSIAENVIGDATLWPALYQANRDQIKDPALVYPGQKLEIPEIQAGTRTAIRRDAENLIQHP